MDNGDTGSLKNNKKMDANTIWQWCITHVKKYSRNPEPFHYSRKMGLDFNVESNTHKKLDLHSLTNGVILEVCDFAKTVRKSKWHFITNILENNFDLGLKSKQQRIEFTSQILHKVRDLIRKPPENKHEAFNLFDTSSEPECTSKDKSGLNMGSIEYKTDCFLVDIDDMDESEHEDKLECSRAPSKDYMKMEEMDGPRADDSDDDDELECSEPQSTEELKEDVVPCSFPCCAEIGLSLDVWSKQSLDPGLLTKGMMLELVQFTRTLTASYRSIVLSVLEHNFELDLKSQQEKNQVWFKVLDLLKRRERLITDFKSEPFSFQTNPLEKGSPLPSVGASLYHFEVSKTRQSDLRLKQEKRALSTTREHVSKRRRTEQAEQEETNTLSHHTDLWTSQTLEDDHSYMCPLDSDEVTDSDDENGDYLQNQTTSDIHNESESSCVGKCEPFITSTDGSSSFPIASSNVNPTFASQPDERGQYGHEEKTHISRNVPYKCNMEEEEMEMESNMWKLRANRVKRILFSLDKDYGAFIRSKRIGLEFNVGFGPKQNFSVDSLYNSVLLEVAKFALAMNSSQQDFIMEILEYNFDFGLKSEHHRKTFASEVMNRVRQLKNSDDAVKLSKKVFGLPGLVSSVNMDSQSMGSVNPEVGRISRTTECDVAPLCPPDLQAENKEHRVDIYPFCKDIGLKLNVIGSQPHKKLEINKLTNGAMTEVTNFAERLCGKFDKICLDILRHNFDLDWQNGNSNLAKTILTRIPVIMEHKNLSNLSGSKRLKNSIKDLSVMVMDCQNNPNLDKCSTGSSQAPIIEQNAGSSIDTEKDNKLNLGLWKLRANQTQQILSVPHVEHCPLYSYSRCKKLGIDFNVGSGVKQNLDPKLLTNGIMVEVSTLATALQSAQKDFITEILEYNFHLTFNNEICRSVFAQQVLDKMARLTFKCNKSRFLKMPFELPDSRFINESTYPKKNFCPKCYEDRNYELCQDQANPVNVPHPRPHAMTDAVFAEADCTAQTTTKDLSSPFQAAEETIMDSYPYCKKIGLSLCMDKDKPRDKLDIRELTRGIMREVGIFAKRLCGTKNKLINDVVEHNFNIGMQSRDVNPALLFQRMVALHNKGPKWFSDIFVIQPYPNRDPRDMSKQKAASAMQKNERKETTKKRQLALQTKKEEATLMMSEYRGAVKIQKDKQSCGDHYPICKGIGVDLDLQNQRSCDTHSQSESNCLSTHEPFLTSTDGPSSFPILNSNVNPTFESQLDERGQCGDEKKTEIPRNVPYKCDMEEEEMETESNMWKLRANRVKQILSLQEKEYCAFLWSKKAGLEFNVGFGQRQNFSVDTLSNSILLEIAKFAIAMNSSQQDFIMEILEYNLDFGLWSENHRNTFACEVMNRVRQLKNSEDAVKLSKEVFELPGVVSSVNMASQSMGSVNPEVSSISRTTECDVAPMCPPDLQAENKEHRVDIYPFCKDIDLKLNVIGSQPNKKLEINKLTNGAMTEVTNFAERLCGTFDQICLDILRHNFDLDWQNGDSDLAKTILTRIPVILEQKNLSNVATFKKIKPTKHKEFLMMVMDCQNSPNLDTCSTGSSQAPIIDQNVGNSIDTEQDNELDLLLWKLRADQIQQILSVPHVEHCLFYSYSRCKKIGIDFNVGSGVKQNLDPKLLTNGIMVEINTFATTLQSAQKDFITEILEYNFHLNLKNEVCRNVFAQQVSEKVNKYQFKFSKPRYLKMPFELPDSKCIEESTYPKTKYCPKCYQDRNYKLCQDESNPDHVLHPRLDAMTDMVSAEVNCTAQKPKKDLSSAFKAAEETIMDSYRLCKKIGLSLCVDKEKPKDKLEPRVLTRGIIKEVASFSKRLCGTKNKLINDVLEHNFNFGMQRRDVNLALLFQRMLALYGEGPTWFSEVFVIQPCTPRELRDVRKVEDVSAMQENERKETTKKRKRALQTKKEEATMLSDNMGALKPRRGRQSIGDCYPICTEMDLDLDVASKSGDKEKLDLKLLTRAAVMEIYKFLSKKARHYFPGTLFDILDYNFDLSSQHYRRWEFSIATASKVKTMVKQYRYYLHRENEVFKLPFVFERKESKRLVQERQNKTPKSSVETTTNEGCRAVQQLRNLSDVNHAHLLNVKTNKELWFEEEDTKSQTDPGTIMQMTGSSVSGDCDSRFQGNIQIKEEEDDSHYGTMKPEPVTEEISKPAGSFGYTLTICPNSGGHIKTESETEDAQYYNLAEPQVSEGYARYYVGTKTESSVKTESDSEDVKYEIPVEAAGSSYSMVTICQDTESTLIKQEQENRSVFIMEMFQTKSEVEIKQEQDS